MSSCLYSLFHNIMQNNDAFCTNVNEAMTKRDATENFYNKK